MSITRIIHLHRDGSSQRAPNDATCVGQWSERRRLTSHELRAGFLAYWHVMRRECAAACQPSLVVVVVDGDGLAGTMRLVAQADRPNAAVLGRHGNSDIYLPDDRDLSLRHLMVLTLPQADDDRALRYRLIDLKTHRGIVDEREQAAGALEADGPLFIRCASYAVYVFPVIPGQPAWPRDPEEAWEAMPPRRYEDRGAVRDRAGVSNDASVTDVRALAQPSAPELRLSEASDRALGELSLRTQSASATFVLGESHAQAGVMLGRYARCLHRSVPFRMPRAVSRVHSLLIRIDGTLYAIDAGSRNGQWVGGERVRVHPLDGDQVLELGRETLWVQWRAAH